MDNCSTKHSTPRKNIICTKINNIAKIGTWRYDIDKNQITWSNQIFNLYERDIKLGAPTIEEEKLYYCSEEAEMLSNSAKMAIEQRQDVICRFHPLLPSGRKAIFESAISPDYDEAGKIKALTGIVIDITDLIISEEKIYEINNNYKLLFKTSPFAYQSLDENGHIIDINDTWLEQLGYTAKEVIGKEFGNFLTNKDKVSFCKKFPNLKKTGESKNVKFDLLCKNGQIIYTLFRGKVSYDKKGNFIQTHCIFENITNQKKSEELIKKQIYEQKILNEVSINLVELESRKEILDYIGDIIFKLIPDTYFLICDYKSDNKILKIHKIYGISKYVTIISKLIGVDVTKYTVNLQNYSEKHIIGFKSKKLIGLEDKIFDLSGKTIKKDICEKIEKLLSIKSVYNAGFSWKGEIYGGIAIVLKQDNVENKNLIENIVNITSIALQRVRTKERLISSENKYKLIAEKTSDVIWLMSLDTKSIFVSPSIINFTGFSPDEYLKQSIDDRFTPESAKIAKETFNKDLLNFENELDKVKNYNIKLILEYKLKQGGTKFGELMITPFFDDNNKLAGIHGVTRDVTNQLKSIEQISLLSKVIEQSPVSIIITDIKGNIEYVNPKFINLTGYSLSDVQGKNPKVLNSRMPENSSCNELWETISNGKEWHGEFLNKKKNGELYWEKASISSVKNEKGKITNYVGVKEDITENKRITNENIELIETLKSKNSDLNEFAYIISHNLRAPISNLCGLSSLLVEEPVNMSSKIIIEKIYNSANNLETIIKDLNNILTIKGNLMSVNEDVNVYSLISEIINSLELLIKEKNIEIIVNCDSDFCITIIKSYINSILYNLILNAIKYSDTIKKAKIIINCNFSSDGYILSVEDNGIGIDLEKNGDKLYGMYKRFTNIAEGKGIGLYLVKSQVYQMGGEITVESKLGEGTKFSLYFNK